MKLKTFIYFLIFFTSLIHHLINILNLRKKTIKIPCKNRVYLKDTRVEIETDLKVWEKKAIKAYVYGEGSFKEEITVNGKTTRFSTKVPGSKTILDKNEF